MKLACLFLHDWDGCVCRRCGKKRDDGHDWDGCVCHRCGEKRDDGHDWDGCGCRRCGETRYERHDWDGCTCRHCGKKAPENSDLHTWEFVGTERTGCSMSSSRGGGQHLDPCYGVDCAFCDVARAEAVYVCSRCGLEKREQA